MFPVGGQRGAQGAFHQGGAKLVISRIYNQSFGRPKASFEASFPGVHRHADESFIVVRYRGRGNRFSCSGGSQVKVIVVVRGRRHDA